MVWFLDGRPSQGMKRGDGVFDFLLIFYVQYIFKIFFSPNSYQVCAISPLTLPHVSLKKKERKKERKKGRKKEGRKKKKGGREKERQENQNKLKSIDNTKTSAQKMHRALLALANS